MHTLDKLTNQLKRRQYDTKSKGRANSKRFLKKQSGADSPQNVDGGFEDVFAMKPLSPVEAPTNSYKSRLDASKREEYDHFVKFLDE